MMIVLNLRRLGNLSFVDPCQCSWKYSMCLTFLLLIPNVYSVARNRC